MALQSSGTISLKDIETEFGGDAPTAISEYYGAATGIPETGEISIADFYGASALPPEPPPGPNAWTLAAVTKSFAPYGRLYVGEQSKNNSALYISPDGINIYITDNFTTNRPINHYIMSTAWDLSSATHNYTFLTGALENTPTGIFFSPDGLRMYVIGSSGDDVNYWSLSTAWNLATASFVAAYSIQSTNSSPKGLHFRSDGTRFWTFENAILEQYSLGSAWDLSNRTLDTSIQLSTSETNPTQIWWKPDGTSFFTLGRVSYRVERFDVSTPWDIRSTVEAAGVNSQSLAVYGLLLFGLVVKPDGTQFFFSEANNETINSFTMSTPWVPITGTFDAPTSGFLNIPNVSVNGSEWRPDGRRFFIAESLGDRVRQYEVGTAWDLTTVAGTETASQPTTGESAPRDITFGKDGTRLYFIGTTSDRIYQANLSSPYDLTTMTIIRNISVSVYETNPYSVQLSANGDLLYFLGQSGDDIGVFDLGNPWEVDFLASFDTQYTVALQDTSPLKIRFKPDGTKLFMLGNLTKRVYEFNLSTPWELSSRSLVRSFSVIELGSVTGINVQPNGKRLFVHTNSAFYEYYLDN
jgi:sugar lactone lactonase YvrE